MGDEVVGNGPANAKLGGDELLARCEAALNEAAADQAVFHEDADPAARFIELIAAAIGSGQAHVADPNGDCPAGCIRWGWRVRTTGTGQHVREEPVPSGDRVGWTDGVRLWLNPDAAYKVASAMCGNLAVSPRTLWKRLDERGLLTKEPSRPNLKVRQQLEGARRQVIQLRVDVLEGG